MVWEERNGFMPAILDESDFEEIDRLGAFFARKLRSPESDKLLARLQVHSSKST